MSDEELQFDPTLKKKKKKKKKIDFDDEAEPEVPAAAAASGAADDDAGEGEGEGSAPASATAGAAATATGKDAAAPTGGDALDDLDLDLDLNLAGKKKKKKKKVFEDDEEKGGDDAEGGKTQAASAAGGADDAGAGGDLAGDMGDLNLDDEFSKKKKKKKKAKDFDGNEENTDAAQAAGASGSTGGEKADSDRDYTHEELLARVFEIMRSKNPDMIAGEKRKFTVKPPQVMKSGTKKTSFVNFSEICKIFRRPPDHLLLFLMAELGTTGSVDGSNALVIKGRFQPKQIESVLKRYIREYVTCHTCKSPDTILRKENRLSFLQCETCGSKCSVASIKSGYQAVVGKRSAVRANDG